MKIEFRLFHESKKPPNAEKAIRAMRNFTQANFEIKKVETYLDKGCLVICETTFISKDWERLIFEVLCFAQQFGMSWTIHDDVKGILSLSTTRFSGGNGVTLATIDVARELLG